MASLLVGTASCIKDDASLTSECDRGPANVRLMVQNDATRSIGSSDTDNEVRQLRIYAFKADEKVGYAYVENVPQGMAYVPMSLSESGNIRFYVLANDGFATGANVGGTLVSDWESLTRQQLNVLQFTSWQEVGDECISPMVNNASYTKDVNIEPNKDGWQVVSVNVQHILARLRLLLNKEGDGDIVITGAKVIHRPDNYMLFTPRTVDVVTFNGNSDQAVDELIAEDVPVTVTTDDDSYQEIGRTFLKPNAYGSTNPDEYVPYVNYDGLSKSYIFSIDYTTGGTPKHKDVYLPRVLRNQSIDVEGTLRSGSLELAVTVNDWEDGGSFDMSYGEEFSGTLTLESGNPFVGVDADQAYAVTYSDAAVARHDLTFSLNITQPIGATWTANLTNGGAFEVVKADGTAASGGIDGQPVTLTVRPTAAYDVAHPAETELYITLTRNSQTETGGEENRGEQIINSDLSHPGTATRIKIRQIAPSDWPSQP